MNGYMRISNKFINLTFNMFMEYYNTVQHATRLRCSILDLVHYFDLVNELFHSIEIFHFGFDSRFLVGQLFVI